MQPVKGKRPNTKKTREKKPLEHWVRRWTRPPKTITDDSINLRRSRWTVFYGEPAPTWQTPEKAKKLGYPQDIVGFTEKYDAMRKAVHACPQELWPELSEWQDISGRHDVSLQSKKLYRAAFEARAAVRMMWEEGEKQKARRVRLTYFVETPEEEQLREAKEIWAAIKAATEAGRAKQAQSATRPKVRHWGSAATSGAGSRPQEGSKATRRLMRAGGVGELGRRGTEDDSMSARANGPDEYRGEGSADEGEAWGGPGEARERPKEAGRSTRHTQTTLDVGDPAFSLLGHKRALLLRSAYGQLDQVLACREMPQGAKLRSIATGGVLGEPELYLLSRLFDLLLSYNRLGHGSERDIWDVIWPKNPSKLRVSLRKSDARYRYCSGPNLRLFVTFSRELFLDFTAQRAVSRRIRGSKWREAADSYTRDYWAKIAAASKKNVEQKKNVDKPLTPPLQDGY